MPGSPFWRQLQCLGTGKPRARMGSKSSDTDITTTQPRSSPSACMQASPGRGLAGDEEQLSAAPRLYERLWMQP